MSMDAQDWYVSGSSSNCCGAEIDLHGLCRDCGEHCEDEAEEGPSDEKMERMNEQAHRIVERREIKAQQDERDLHDAGRGHLVR